jgi:iron complex transport system substrate-binding protein
VTRVGRATLWILGAFLVVTLLGVLLALSRLEEHAKRSCLDQGIAPEPQAGFVRQVVAGADARRIVYDDGTEVRVPLEPRRIVSSLPGITELICHLGGRERLVAVSPWCDHPPSVAGIRKVKVQPFDAEGILAAEPDLVVVDRRLHRQDLERIRLRCPAVLLLDTSRSLPHLAVSAQLLAAVLETPEAKRRADAFQDRLYGSAARIRAAAPETPPRVLVVAQWDPLYVLGRGSLIDDLLRVCGCVNVACDLEGDASGTFDEELVLARRPDWILTPREPMPDRIAQRWRNVPAVKQGRLTDGAADDLVRAGPRILDGLERLARVLRGAAGDAR